MLLHLDYLSNISCKLKLAGHIILNHGPNEIIRLGQGSFNQGNIALFSETAVDTDVRAIYCFQSYEEYFTEKL